MAGEYSSAFGQALMSLPQLLMGISKFREEQRAGRETEARQQQQLALQGRQQTLAEQTARETNARGLAGILAPGTVATPEILRSLGGTAMEAIVGPPSIQDTLSVDRPTGLPSAMIPTGTRTIQPTETSQQRIAEIRGNAQVEAAQVRAMQAAQELASLSSYRDRAQQQLNEYRRQLLGIRGQGQTLQEQRLQLGIATAAGQLAQIEQSMRSAAFNQQIAAANLRANPNYAFGQAMGMEMPAVPTVPDVGANPLQSVLDMLQNVGAAPSPNPRSAPNPPAATPSIRPQGGAAQLTPEQEAAYRALLRPRP